MIHGNEFNVYDLLRLTLALKLMEENERIFDEICDLQEELSDVIQDESINAFLKRAAFNLKNVFSDGLEDKADTGVADLIESVFENVDDARQLKALIETINLLADTTPETDYAEMRETEDVDDSEDDYANAEALLPAPHRDDED